MSGSNTIPSQGAMPVCHACLRPLGPLQLQSAQLKPSWLLLADYMHWLYCLPLWKPDKELSLDRKSLLCSLRCGKLGGSRAASQALWH